MIRTATQLKAKVRNLSGQRQPEVSDAYPEFHNGTLSGTHLTFPVQR